MRWSAAVRALLVSCVVLSFPLPASAWTEFLSMDVLPETVGWIPQFDGSPGGSSTVSGGVLTLTAAGYREYVAPASWIHSVSVTTGYTIEFRMRIVNAPVNYPFWHVGVWCHDNTSLTIIGIDAGRIYVSVPGNGLPYVDLDATAWHTYRIVVQGTHHTVYVDGAPALDYQDPGTTDGTRNLVFGDLAQAGSSQTEWDYFAYETGAVVPVSQTSWGKIKAFYRDGR